MAERTKIQKIVGLNLNLQDARHQIGMLLKADFVSLSPSQQEKTKKDIVRLEGHIDYCTSEIRKLQEP